MIKLDQLKISIKYYIKPIKNNIRNQLKIKLDQLEIKLQPLKIQLTN